tara:strand:+ start:174 stop:482 length:309 start_codon:yes stop_codon:yes gene_type:complete
MPTNTLVGAFSSIQDDGLNIEPNKLICIDTSNNRLGIHTIDPSYSIDVRNLNDTSGVIYSDNLIVNRRMIFRNIKSVPPFPENLLISGEIYSDNLGFLKIKL